MFHAEMESGWPLGVCKDLAGKNVVSLGGTEGVVMLEGEM